MFFSIRVIKNLFLDFFKNKNHKVIPSSSLIPSDGTSLFTTAGVQQFIPFILSPEEPPFLRACSSQICFRSDDIEEIGDNFHLTFFEMLGNWSFGDYFKKEAISFAFEFLTKVLQIPQEKLWITYFKGEKGIPEDRETLKIWQNLGIPQNKILPFGAKDNFWGPIGKEGPCGPSTEIHFEINPTHCNLGKECLPNCSCGRFVEIWNLVFMQYNKKNDGHKFQYLPLPRRVVDTGMGLERIATAIQGKTCVFETDLFFQIINEIERLTQKKYSEDKISFRILADHIRSIVFLLAEGIFPSNVEQGYVLRRLLRRSMRFEKKLQGESSFDLLIPLANKVIEIYLPDFPMLSSKQEFILTQIQKEEEKFENSLNDGLKYLNKLLNKKKEKFISGSEAFSIYQTYGLPFEVIEDFAKENNFTVSRDGFEEEFRKHQEISRRGAEKKFGGHGLDRIENQKSQQEKIKITKLHTATHLLHSALRKILGEEARQMGSDINEERLRFDFSFKRKLTQDEIQKIEDLVNQKIKENLKIKKEKMFLEDALKSGALAFFKERYPREVYVYSIYNLKTKEVFSKEVCNGPHRESTGDLGIFKIKKEEAVGAGIRRIRAILE